MNTNQMEQLLKQLLTMNNDNRSRGEGALAELEKHPESYLSSLVAVGSGAPGVIRLGYSHILALLRPQPGLHSDAAEAEHGGGRRVGQALPGLPDLREGAAAAVVGSELRCSAITYIEREGIEHPREDLPVHRRAGSESAGSGRRTHCW